jgi:hypothetical protein
MMNGWNLGPSGDTSVYIVQQGWERAGMRKYKLKRLKETVSGDG